MVLDGLPLAQSRPAKDYVLQPKPNGYQSLHLALELPSGLPLELQVRTRCMHEHAERGGARHGEYKRAELQKQRAGRGGGFGARARRRHTTRF